MTAERDAKIREFLKAAGWPDARTAPLAGDASNRRYLRIHRTSGDGGVLMDAPPERGENVVPFVAMTQWLGQLGLSVPHVLHADFAAGLLLLDDLGDDLFARHLEGHPDQEADLYRAAIDVLVELSAHTPPQQIGFGQGETVLPSYDRAVLDREAGLAIEWYLPTASGVAVSDTMAADYRALVQRATGNVEDSRDVVVLRDYHAENLIWLPDRDSNARVGLLDYQDALSGHPAYDLVSLLEDARRDTPPALQRAMVDTYLTLRPEIEAGAFRAAYAALGAQRNLKIIGIFARLAIRDGKPRYLDLIPRVWAHLCTDLAHPDLGFLREWVEAHVPAPDARVLTRLKGAR